MQQPFSEIEIQILTYALTATGDIGFNLNQQAKLQRAARTFIDVLDTEIDAIANQDTDE